MITLIDKDIPYIQGVLEPFTEVIYAKAQDFSSLMTPQVQALLVRTRTHCNADLLAGKNVRFIATATIGFDHIDTHYLKQKGIYWTNAPGCNARSVAQYITSSLLLLAQNKKWNLSKMCLGIVGVGHVGTEVKKLAETLGMRVLLNDPPREKAEQGKDNSLAFCSMKEIQEQADIITFHTPLTCQGQHPTHHLVNQQWFDSLTHPVVLINTSRGEVVDTTALLQAKAQGLINEIIIDCWENEPHISIPLLEQCFLATPHIAGYSADGKANASRHCVMKFGEFFHHSINMDKIVPPDPENSVIDLDFANDALFKSLLTTYDPRQDDRRLRENPSLFESLRSNYPLRREALAYTLEHVPEELTKQLSALGFGIKAQ